MAKQDHFVRTALRLPPELHAEIHAAAEESQRTFNAEIVERLAKSFQQGQIDQSLLRENETLRNALKWANEVMETTNKLVTLIVGQDPDESAGAGAALERGDPESARTIILKGLRDLGESHGKFAAQTETMADLLQNSPSLESTPKMLLQTKSDDSPTPSRKKARTPRS